MRFPILIAIMALAFSMLVDAYVYCALHSYFKRRIWSRIQLWTSLAFYAALVLAICLPKRGGGDKSLLTVMWILYAYFSVYLPKLLFVIFDVLSRLPMLWRGKRWVWMSWVGAGAGAAVFLSIWWGAIVTPYTTQVKEESVEISALPSAFEGLKMAQISDLHVGTFGSDTAFVSRLVDEINELRPDVIVFTGDIVNRKSSELKPFVKTLSRLNAPLGVYSVMGNHDYSLYSDWKTEADRIADVRELQSMQKTMGWKMLNNATQWLRIGNDSIALIGVENVGDPPFRTFGDLKKAYPDISDEQVKILLSHNPAHWNGEIADRRDANIALTLSGHTHAMQIEVLGFSPASWRYPTWGGMYADTLGRKLYVNIGAGEVGFPARIGATPEITLLTLKNKQ